MVCACGFGSFITYRRVLESLRKNRRSTTACDGLCLIIWFGEVLQICCQVLYGFIFFSRRVFVVSIYRDGAVGRRFCARGHTNRKFILGNFRGPIWVLI